MSVFKKSYCNLPLSESEIARYARAKVTDAAVREMIRASISEAEPILAPRVCYTKLELDICGGVCNFGAFSVKSELLSKNLAGCHEVIIVASTVGLEIDRLIKKYSTVSPSRALIMSAVGTDAVEKTLDAFAADIAKEYKLRPRFSAGYGDLPLDTQPKIFQVLDAPKNLGLSLTDGLVMSPTKSVTAFIGLEKK